MNNTCAYSRVRPGLEPGLLDPESSALTTRPPRLCLFPSAKLVPKSCTDLRNSYPVKSTGSYVIDPDGKGGLEPFTVYCNISDKNGVDVTVISYDSKIRTSVDGFKEAGTYSHDIHYTGASLSQLASHTRV